MNHLTNSPFNQLTIANGIGMALGLVGKKLTRLTLRWAAKCRRHETSLPTVREAVVTSLREVREMSETCGQALVT